MQKPVAVLGGGCSTDPSVTAKSLIEGGVHVYRNTLSCGKRARSDAYGEFCASGGAHSERPSATEARLR